MWEGNPCRCVHAQDATVDSLYQPRRTLGSHHENTAGGVDTTDMENTSGQCTWQWLSQRLERHPMVHQFDEVEAEGELRFS